MMSFEFKFSIFHMYFAHNLFVYSLLSSSRVIWTWLVHRRGKATISGSVVTWNTGNDWILNRGGGNWTKCIKSGQAWQPEMKRSLYYLYGYRRYFCLLLTVLQLCELTVQHMCDHLLSGNSQKWYLDSPCRLVCIRDVFSFPLAKIILKSMLIS